MLILVIESDVISDCWRFRAELLLGSSVSIPAVGSIIILSNDS